jgi:hypothetical protein
MTITQIKRRYTKIKKRGGDWYCWLRVDQQSFRLAANGGGAKSDIEWFRNQLANALKKIIEQGGKA